MVGNYMYNEQDDTYFLLSNLTTRYDPAWWKDAEPLWVAAEKQVLIFRKNVIRFKMITSFCVAWIP
jgi:hypothetical protein